MLVIADNHLRWREKWEEFAQNNELLSQMPRITVKSFSKLQQQLFENGESIRAIIVNLVMETGVDDLAPITNALRVARDVNPNIRIVVCTAELDQHRPNARVEAWAAELRENDQAFTLGKDQGVQPFLDAIDWIARNV